MAASPPWPTQIRLLPQKQALFIAFENGESGTIPAELLRVRSPSAEVRGHTPSEQKLVAGKRAVQILAVEAVGNYAVRLRFDDLHDSGLYGWPLLQDFARNGAQYMADYEAELALKGLSRG